MAIVFQNKGLIDIRAIKTFGASVKKTETAIGFFGTGLKYAIAVILRHGGSITIYRGNTALRFDVKPMKIRGEQFPIVTMNGKELAFTTEYGKTWEPWQAFRELWCNCKDEGGKVFSIDDETPAGMSFLNAPFGRDVTTIIASGKAIEDAYKTRASIILETEPMMKLSGVDVHHGISDHIFYQGIRVHKLEKPSMYTYNLTNRQSLTEDRTLAYSYGLPALIGRAHIGNTFAPMIADILTDKKGNDSHFEHMIPWVELKGATPSPQFVAVAEDLWQKKLLSKSAEKLFHDILDKTPGRESPLVVNPSAVELVVINDAKELLRRKGVDADRFGFIFKTNDKEDLVYSSRLERSITITASSIAKGRDHLSKLMLIGIAMAHQGRLSDQLANFVLNGFFINKTEEEDDKLEESSWGGGINF